MTNWQGCYKHVAWNCKPLFFQILDDGTVVKINRTRYSDVSDDGSSFFGFHSTSFFSGSDEDKNKEDNMPEDKVVEATTEAAAADAAEEDEPIKLVRQNNANVRKWEGPAPEPCSFPRVSLMYNNNTLVFYVFSSVDY